MPIACGKTLYRASRGAPQGPSRHIGRHARAPRSARPRKTRAKKSPARGRGFFAVRDRAGGGDYFFAAPLTGACEARYMKLSNAPSLMRNHRFISVRYFDQVS